MEGIEGWNIVAESGCGSAGSLSEGLPLRRVVRCAEEVAGRSGDVSRWRFVSRVSRWVEMHPPELVCLCRGSGVGEERGGIGGRTGKLVRASLVDCGSPCTCD